MSASTILITADDGGSFNGYLAKPREEKAAAVLILQEIFGVNAHIRHVVEQYAEAGYLALAPDMFWRIQPDVQLDYTAEGVQQARSLRGKFDLAAGMRDITAALQALAARAECNGKVAVVGYCFGGLLAYLTAARNEVSAASCYYGGGIDSFIAEAAAVKCPIQFHFGSADQAIPLSAVEKVRAAFAANRDAQVFVYEGAGHGFNCERRASFHPEASKLAGERTFAMLRTCL